VLHAALTSTSPPVPPSAVLQQVCLALLVKHGTHVNEPNHTAGFGCLS
jgi:hypothetical protein